MVQKLRNSLLFIIMILSLICVWGQEFFTEKSSYWVGGALNYSNILMENSYDRVQVIQFSPYVRGFVDKNIMLGPRFQWTGLIRNGGRFSCQTGIGLDIGFAKNRKAWTVIPYGRIGGQLDIYSLGKASNDTPTGFTLPIGIGLFVKTKGIIVIQIEPSLQMKWVEEERITILSFSVGLGGIGRKFAISGIAGSGSVHY